MGGRDRWAYRRWLTASLRRSPDATWSRSWSRCFTPTPTATDPANLRSMPCARLASAAGAATGCSISTSRGFFDSIDWELLLKAARHHTDCPWVLWMARTFAQIPFERYADGIICHCKSAEEARALWGAI